MEFFPGLHHLWRIRPACTNLAPTELQAMHECFRIEELCANVTRVHLAINLQHSEPLLMHGLLRSQRWRFDVAHFASTSSAQDAFGCCTVSGKLTRQGDSHVFQQCNATHQA